MEVSELITIIREDYLDDVFDGWEDATDVEQNDQFLWSNKALLRYITEAQRQACNRTDFLYDDSSTELTQIKLKENVRDYSFSSKITAIEDVVYNDKKVRHISKEERDRYLPQWRSATGMGTNTVFYLIRARKIFVYPLPDANDAGNILNLTLYHQPLDDIVSASDELVIPEEFHRDLIWWVLYEAYSKQDADGYDKEKGLGYLANFEHVFGGYVPSEVRLNQMQEPEGLRTRPVNYIRSTDDYEVEGWYDDGI